jgi:hypothetical protein
MLIEKRPPLHIFLNGPKGSAFVEFALSERTAELRNYSAHFLVKITCSSSTHEQKENGIEKFYASAVHPLGATFFFSFSRSTFCASAGN